MTFNPASIGVHFNFFSRKALQLATALLTISLLAGWHSAHADVRAAHTALVSENASFFTPGAIDGQVNAIAIDGDTVFVGGSFTQIQEALEGEIIDQPYLFAYSKSTGAILRDFDPVLNKEVFALQTTGEGSGIFAGGAFTTVNGETNRKGLVKLDDFGDRVRGFAARPDKRVFTMDRSGDTLFIGGNFLRIGSQPIEYLAAVDTTTGELLPDINLDFDGFFTSDRAQGFPSVDDIEVTSDGELMVVVGNFQNIGGIERSRLALLELGDRTLGEQAVVSQWNTDVFDIDCPANWRFPQYIKGIDLAPDDSYLITGTTGYYRTGEPACDSILRFELTDLTNTDVQPTWKTLTGGDSVYEVAASEHAVYAGGHFRTLNNDFSPNGGRSGPGAIERDGLAALDPRNGLPILSWRSDRTPRGLGTFALEVQPEGLYIGDDTDVLNGFRHPRFKFLPVSSETIIRPEAPTLPTSIFRINDGGLDAIAFDGITPGAVTAVSDTSWSNARGAMFLGGQLFHADDEGNVWVRVLNDDDTFGPATPVNLFGLTTTQWDIARVSGMFFDHEYSRAYYTLVGDSRLFWRAFTPSGPLFGENQFVADDQGDILWSNVQGMDVIDGWLYFGYTDGNLYRAQMDGASPLPGTTELLSGPGIDGQDWNHPFLAFSADGEVLPPPTPAQFEFEFAGSESFKSFKTFEFPVAPGEPVSVRISWDNPDAQLNVFLRDPNGQLLDSDNNVNGSSPKWLNAPAGIGGIHTVAVKINQGETTYDVSVNPQIEAPAPLAEFEFSSSGTDSPADGRFQTFRFDVLAGETVDAKLEWDDLTADVRLFLRDETGTLIARDTDGIGSAAVTTVATTSGTWSAAVLVRTAADRVSYDLLVDTLGENLPLTITAQPADAIAINGGMAAFAVTATGSGTLSYQWFANATEIVGETSNILTVDSVTLDDSETVYSVQVTDANGSITSDTATLLVRANIAVNGTASQSSDYSVGVASRANDGNTNGDWRGNSVAITLREPQPWWEVRLADTSSIDAIVVYNRTDGWSDRLSNYTVTILDDNGNTVFSRFFSDPPAVSREINVDAVSGRTVRIQLNGTNYLQLAEVQVFGVGQDTAVAEQ